MSIDLICNYIFLGPCNLINDNFILKNQIKGIVSIGIKPQITIVFNKLYRKLNKYI